MKAIVAVNKKWSIGNEGELLYSLPGDMRFFRETTKGKIVIMGRKTLDSFPQGKPLKNRVNIVISRSKKETEGVLWANTPVDALSLADDFDNTFLIGGDSIYRQLIDYCDEAFVTVVDDEKEGDSFFPNLNEREGWVLYESSDDITENGLSYRFCKFKNKNPRNYK